MRWRRWRRQRPLLAISDAFFHLKTSLDISMHFLVYFAAARPYLAEFDGGV